MHYPTYRDRREAGRALAAQLRKYRGRSDAAVLALPRGGVPVAYEVADDLGAPLDVLVVRRLGLPGHEEFAFGAVASGGICVLDQETLERFPVSKETADFVVRKEMEELERRDGLYRGDRPRPDLPGRTLIVVDDGLATGSTMRAAVLALRARNPLRIVAAVPVGSWKSCGDLASVADEVVCAMTPSPFYAVGQWYDDFSETPDSEVRRLLQAADEKRRLASEPG